MNVKPMDEQAILDQLQSMLQTAAEQKSLAAGADFGDEASLQRMQELLTKRQNSAAMIDELRQGQPLPEAARPVLETLQQMDATYQERVRAVMEQLRGSLKKVHTGRRGRQAYGAKASGEGAFIDKKN